MENFVNGLKDAQLPWLPDNTQKIYVNKCLIYLTASFYTLCTGALF